MPDGCASTLGYHVGRTFAPMPLIKEFKKFAMRGNVIDLAVGVIIGGAFGKIVNSLVGDVFMPVASVFTSKVDFKRLFISLDGKEYASLEGAQRSKAPVLTYGQFFQNVIEFLIIAFVIFLVVLQINKLKSPAEAPASKNKECPFCISKIPENASRCPQCTSTLS